MGDYRTIETGSLDPRFFTMAKRADAAPINRVPWVNLNQKVKGLVVYPKDNNCQGSQEKASPVGLAVDKNQQVYLDWLRQVEKTLQATLTADEKRVIDNIK